MTVTALPVEELVERAVAGDQAAWDAIVDRYAPIVWSMCRQFRLSDADAADVSQTVWLRTVERLGSLREPAALPGWLSTVTRRECIHASSDASRRPWALETETHDVPADPRATAVDAGLLEAEQRAMLQEAFAALSERCRRLLSLVFEADPRPYQEISARLGMPTGSIGPTRSRCLDRLRSMPVLQKWVGAADVRAEGHHA